MLATHSKVAPIWRHRIEITTDRDENEGIEGIEGTDWLELRGHECTPAIARNCRALCTSGSPLACASISEYRRDPTDPNRREDSIVRVNKNSLIFSATSDQRITNVPGNFLRGNFKYE